MTDANPDEMFEIWANNNAILAQRLILAALTDTGEQVDINIDTDRDIIVAQVGDCPDRWRAIATYAVLYAAGYMRLHCGEDEAIALMQQTLERSLDSGTV